MSNEKTRPVTIHLPEDVYLYVELQAAKDDDRIAEGIERMLIELARAKKEGRPVQITKRPHT